jgi:hypothetical protein
MTDLTGLIVQYRKVGTFEVLGRTAGSPQYADSGWHDCVAVNAPKSYRDKGVISIWVGIENVVE